MKTKFLLLPSLMAPLVLLLSFLLSFSMVSAQSGDDVADEIDGLRDQVTLKIDEDLQRTATAFADARELNRSLFWSDLFSAPLQIFKDTLSGLMIWRDLNGMIKPVDVRRWSLNSITVANSAHEVISTMLSMDRLKQDGTNLAMAIDGASYAARTEGILQRAEQNVSFFTFDRRLYEDSIRYDLYGIGGVATPLPVLRRSGVLDRRGGSVLPTIFEARRTIINELKVLSDQLRATEMSATLAQSLINHIITIKQSVLQSRAGAHNFNYQTVLEDDTGLKSKNVGMSLGYPRSLESWRGLMLDRFVANTSVEIRLRTYEAVSYSAGLIAGEVIDQVNLKLDVDAVIAGQATANKIALGAGALTMGVISGQVTAPLDTAREMASNARQEVTYIPQQMMDALPGEVGNLLMIADDVVRKINFETRKRPKISGVSPSYLTGKPVPQTTRITISGENFTTSSRLEFNDGVNAPYTNRMPATWSSTQLTYDVVVGLEAANWTVKVVDGGVSSPPYAFYVIPPAGGKTLTGLAIEGPATVNSGGTSLFKAKAHYSDSSSAYVSATWSENSSSASISSGGLLSASSVSSNREVIVSASYGEGSETRNASTIVMIVTSSGSAGSETNNVIVNGNFESGRTPWSPHGYADVAALSYPRGGSWYAYIGSVDNASGAFSQFFPISTSMTDAVLEFYLNVSSDETTTTNVFDEMTVSLATQFDQHVADIATFSNLDKRTPGSYVKKSYNIRNIINAYKGQSLFLVFSGTTDASLQTTFRIDDMKLNMTTSTPVSLVDLRIDGDSALPENGFFAYRAMAVFSDGTTQLVSPNSWSENSSVSTIDSSGFFITSSVATTSTVTVSTSYTFIGVTRNASKQVSVFPRSNPPILDRLTIEGPGWVDEGSYINMVGKAIFSNGSVQTVTPIWSLSSSWASINSNGRVTANQVTGDRTLTLGASFSSGGITKTANHEVMIIDGDATPLLDRIEIVGHSTIEEGMNEAYDVMAYFTDGSSRYVNPSWSENSASASITSYGLLSASYVSSNTSLPISASYTSNGILKSATKSVTIINVPDVLKPALAITSHSSRYVSTAQVLTLSGVATDSGYGNNGITSVMVNGAPATGGSTSSGGFADWSKELTLAEGANVIEVVATDGASNVSTTSIEVIWSPVTELPKLEITRIAGEIELVWPAGWESWTLESTENLVDPASWRAVNTSPTPENGMLKVRAPISGPSRFYRLRSEGAGQ
jgi:hypothetical protein